MSLKFALSPQAAKRMRDILPVTRYNARERENKSNYSEKPGETKNNLSTRIRFDFSWGACMMRSLRKVTLIARHHSVWQVGEPWSSQVKELS